MSTFIQDEKFYELIGELNNFYLYDDNIGNFIIRVRTAFENDEITTSQYDKLVRETDELSQ